MEKCTNVLEPCAICAHVVGLSGTVPVSVATLHAMCLARELTLHAVAPTLEHDHLDIGVHPREQGLIVRHGGIDEDDFRRCFAWQIVSNRL